MLKSTNTGTISIHARENSRSRTCKVAVGSSAVLILLAGLIIAAPCEARCLSSHAKNLGQALNFEGPASGGLPGGWYVVPGGTATLAPVAYQGKWKVVRLQAGPRGTRN